MSNGGTIDNPIVPTDSKTSDSNTSNINSTQNAEDLEEFKRKIEQQSHFRKTEREKNLNRSSPSLSSLVSNVKKNTAFVKRFRTYSTLTTEEKNKLQEEAETLNLKRYITEIVQALSQDLFLDEQRNSLKIDDCFSEDIYRIVKACCTLHQYYEDFTETLIPSLLKNINYSVIFGSSDQIFVVAVEFSKLKLVVRLLCEFYLVGMINDVSEIFKIFKNTIGKDVEKRLVTLFLDFALLFVKFYGDEFLGFLDNKIEPVEIRQLKAFVTKETKVVSDQEQKQFKDLFIAFLKSNMEKLYAVHLQLKQEEEEQQQQQQEQDEKGAEDEKKNSYIKKRKNWIGVYTMVRRLAKYLCFEIPDKLSEGEFRMEEVEKEKLIKQQAISNLQENLFEDEETRAFYEDIPDIFSLVKEKDPNAPILHDQSSTVPTTSTTNTKGKESSGNATAAQIDAHLNKLPSCCSRTLIAKWAVDFILMGAKSAKKKLAKTLFGVNRTSLELLPHYSRLVAILLPIFKDLGSSLVSMLEEEFNTLFSEKDQIKIESKIKNIRFLSELTKFKICSPNLIVNCLDRCLNDFTHHNIDVTCHLLETCGRFLFYSKETHDKADALLEKMMRLKEVKSLDVKYETMIENAYYTIKPAQDQLDGNQTSKSITGIPPLHQYINYLLFVELNKFSANKVLKQLRKLPWKSDPQIYRVVLDCVRNNLRNLSKFSSIHVLAGVIASLSRYHELIGVAVVDRLLEDIRCGLSGEFEISPQRRILDAKFLSELYNYQLLDSLVIFDQLYTILFYASSEDVILSDDSFRLRLVCTILDTVGQYLDTNLSKKRLDKFLAYLQLFVLEKRDRLTYDVQLMLADTLEALKPKLKWPATAEEAKERIYQIENRRAVMLPCYAHGRTVMQSRETLEGEVAPALTSVSANENNSIWPILKMSGTSTTNDGLDEENESSATASNTAEELNLEDSSVSLANQQELEKKKKIMEEEANDLDKELQMLINESVVEKQTQLSHASSIRKLANSSYGSIPSLTNWWSAPKRQVEGGPSVVSTSASENLEHEKMIPFTFLKRGTVTSTSSSSNKLSNKQEKLELNIPASSSLASATLAQMKRKEEEEEERKRVTQARHHQIAQEYEQQHNRRQFSRKK